MKRKQILILKDEAFSYVFEVHLPHNIIMKQCAKNYGSILNGDDNIMLKVTENTDFGQLFDRQNSTKSIDDTGK